MSLGDLFVARLEDVLRRTGPLPNAFMAKPVQAPVSTPPDGPPVVLGLLDGEPLRDRQYAPVLVVGASECGKTSGILLTTAAEHECSGFYFDFKGELKRKIPRLRERFGPVAVVEFHRRGGPRWNPLMEVREGDDFESDCRRMAEILSDREGGRREHWDDAGINYMTGVIAHVLLSGADKTLRGIRAHVLRRDDGAKEMVEHGRHQMVRDAGAAVFKHASAKEAGGDEKAEDWAAKKHGARNAATGRHVDKSGRDRGDEEKEQEKKSGYRDSIYSTCETHLALIESKVLADQTEVSDFRFSDLMAMDKPMTLILSCRPRDLKNWRKMYKLFMVMMIDALADDEDYTADGRKKLHDAIIAIDEFLRFHFEEVEDWICYVRSFRLKLLLLAQGMGSVKEQCQPSILENCTRLVFRPKSPEEALLIETIMGKEDIESPSKSISRGNPLNWETVSEGLSITQRPRHSTMDVLTMPRSVVFAIGLEHLYLLQAPRPWLDQPWASYWKERVGPSTTPWIPTAGASPWLNRKPWQPPAPAAAPAAHRKPAKTAPAPAQKEMPI